MKRKPGPMPPRPEKINPTSRPGPSATPQPREKPLTEARVRELIDEAISKLNKDPLRPPADFPQEPRTFLYGAQFPSRRTRRRW